MRDAQVLLDQALSFAGKKIAAADLIDILGVPDRQVLYDLSSAIIARDPGRCLDLLERVFSSGHDLKRLGEDLLEHFRNLLVLKIAGNADRLIDLPQAEIDTLSQQADAVSPEDLYLYFRSLTGYLESLPRASSPRIHLEMALARLSSLPAVASIGGLIQRLEALEGRLSGSEPAGDRVTSVQPPEDKSVPVKASSPALEDSSVPSNQEGKSWREFLQFVRERKPRIASYLEKGEVLEAQGGKIRVGFPQKSLFCEHLKEQEESSALQRLAEEFYPRAPKIECVEAPEAPGTHDTHSMPEGEKKAPQNALEDPIVRDALQIFGGGEVVKTKKL